MRIRGRMERGSTGAATRRARVGTFVRSLEPLEGRALLSLAALAGWSGAAVPAEVAGLAARRAAHARGQAAQASAALNHGPLNERIVGGHVSKAPRFYSEYTGPRLAELNGIGAMGQLVPGVGYVFTGRVLGPIDPTHSASYVFGVDRGGASSPKSISPPTPDGGVNYSGGSSIVMFPRRPNIFADALVTATVGSAGTRGSVRLMGQSPDQATPLPADNIHISGRDVTVVVPPSMLSPNGLPANGFAYAFWTQGDAQGASGVASFVPEYNVTEIGFHG